MTRRARARRNKSIRELEDYLDKLTRPAVTAPLRQDLHDRIAELAIH
jgi:hypothetical protein